MTVTQNLERHYDLFANTTSPWEFFSGLGSYCAFIFETTELKNIADSELKKRDEMCRRVNELEEKSLAELREVKQKLLEIIERQHIDPKGFVQYTSGIPNPRGTSQTILDEMELFEKGGILRGRFHSDVLEDYLFDVAANILRLGYGDEIKNFVLPDKDYAEYYRRVNGDMGGLQFGGNQYGNFVFSKTWPERFQQVRAIDRAQKLEPWGAFEALTIFWNGRGAALNDKGLDDLTRNVDELDFDGRRSVDTIYAAQDFGYLARIETAFQLGRDPIHPDGLRYLKMEDFKRHAAMVHTFLLQRIGNTEAPAHEKTTAENSIETKSKLKFDSLSGVLRYGDAAHSFQRGSRGEEMRILFFKKLWDGRRLIKNGVTKIEGRAFPPEYFAVQLNITDDAQGFANNNAAKIKLFALIKGINRILRTKKFPANIERKGGIQLVVVEK